ncbi:hypothetical protein ACTA71_011692 [Dictyostelium dimigraforme]
MKKAITVLVLMAAAKTYAQDCLNLSENECHRNSSCVPVNYKKCCGDQEFACFEGDINSCKYITKCYRSSKSFDVIEATNDCFVPPPGYQLFDPVYSCTNDEIKHCSDLGKQCIFKRNDCPNPTSCCPGHGICEGFNSNGSESGGSGSESGNGNGSESGSSGGSGSGSESGSESGSGSGNENGSESGGKETSTTGNIGPQSRGIPTSGGTGSLPIDACTNVVCQQGEHCEVDKDTGKAHCYVNIESIGTLPLGCLNVVCQQHQHCEYDQDTGKAHCVLDINAIGFTTSSTNGLVSTTTTGSGDVCSNVICPPGFYCQKNEQSGKADCLPQSSSTTGGTGSTTGSIDVCSNVICPPYFHCEKNNKGWAQCAADINAIGFTTSSTNGLVSTTGSSDVCQNVHCPQFFQCEKNENGLAECVSTLIPL